MHVIIVWLEDVNETDLNRLLIRFNDSNSLHLDSQRHCMKCKETQNDHRRSSKQYDNAFDNSAFLDALSHCSKCDGKSASRSAAGASSLMGSTWMVQWFADMRCTSQSYRRKHLSPWFKSMGPVSFDIQCMAHLTLHKHRRRAGTTPIWHSPDDVCAADTVNMCGRALACVACAMQRCIPGGTVGDRRLCTGRITAVPHHPGMPMAL